MTKAQLLEDIKFLAQRQLSAGSFGGHGDRRFTGSSSNSIVAIAYGLTDIKEQYMPSDGADVQSCINMWTIQMPDHRKKGLANKAYQSAINCDWYYKNKYRQCQKCEGLSKKQTDKCDWCGKAIGKENDMG